MYIRRDAVKVVLSSPPFAILLSLSRVVSSCFFFSILYFSFLSRLFPLALGARVYVPIHTYIRREVSLAGTRYIYEEPLPLMVSMRSDATRTCPARSACARTCARVRVYVCVERFLMRACVSMYTRVHVPIPRRAIQSVGKTREDSRIHTRTGPHGRELCLARDVKLLAIS